MSPEICPICGAQVPPNAKACPGCGSDETTGWSEQARYDSLDLPDDEFDYEEFTQREFGSPKPIPRGLHWFWWACGVILLVLIAFAVLRMFGG